MPKTLFNLGFNQLAKVDETTSVLGASGVYTSPNVIECGGNAYIVGSVYSDQAGTLVVEQSSDGTNFDVQDSITVTAATPTKISVEVVAPYAQLKYTNGATAQTTFRLYAFTRGI